MELGEDRDRVGAVAGLCGGSAAVVARQQAGGFEMLEEKSKVTSPCKLLWTETKRSALRLLILVLGSARTKR